MPVYLCKSGWGTAEPWRHGIPVYAYPFPMNESPTGSRSGNDQASSGTNSRPGFTSAGKIPSVSERDSGENYVAPTSSNLRDGVTGTDTGTGSGAGLVTGANNATATAALDEYPAAIRQLKHSEVVLVDEVSVHYNKYWLRLRWPGSRGGIAGYIVLGGTNSVPNEKVREWKERLRGAVGGLEGLSVNADRVNSPAAENSDENSPEDNENENEENNQDSDNESTDEEPAILRPGGNPNDPMHFAPRCESTGLYFPSTTTMELLANYDDGLSALSVISADDNMGDEGGAGGEPVFCRICRDGLHDVDYDFQMEGQADGTKSKPTATANNSPDENLIDSTLHASGPALNLVRNTQDASSNVNNIPAQGGIRRRASPSPPPQHADQINHPYTANPLLAPCECSGSMAFVHYLCIEQWRCRSHHPAARNGLNCETCNAPYTLPPPPARPNVNEEEDWLEAMPPHVLAALRRPHPCWQIGAAIVRRRWLRPIAPVFMSPIVALYCRARRTLKKRGVSRRRWACSLCRRRARWKCVRCLRSYYCSRQCQNVSWHIVHKHVCYKPARFWQSVVVYGLAFVYFVPGVLSHTLVYDLGFGFLWLSFLISGVIGGGFASLMKRRFGRDIRGRGLELIVVLTTLWLANICWGVLWAYFGESNECKGVFNYDMSFIFADKQTSVYPEEVSKKIGFVPKLFRTFVIELATEGLMYADNILLKTGPLLTPWVCHSDETADSNIPTESQKCTRLAQKANPDFMLGENGDNCVSDVHTIAFFMLLALSMHFMNIVWKRTDRLRRAAAAAARHQPRPHQD